ncbi:GTPase activating protein homolog 4-like [Toxorhynchites rutilus septentrionalis]|uniref:GTPase activating protein homolog 4-like n=1 Tax=Toxorhynchites rutilus septentrionalis TaxID=329112 RepID=UPI002479E6F9|nr:GTPase activating protein homolog 4-like [Toxorhynchites rutilus septentrionalis]
MKIIVVMVIAIAGIVSSYRHGERVSQYSYKTDHGVVPYKEPEETSTLKIAEQKPEKEFEAKLAVLSQLLKKYQQTRKTHVTIETDATKEAIKDEPKEELKDKEKEKEKEKETEKEKEKEKDATVPSYEYAYGVKDFKTGDHKLQWEKRVGGHVMGVYKFAESDGTQRVVEYKADDKKGFEAKVKNVADKNSEEDETSKKTTVHSQVAHSYSYLKKYNR